MFYDTASQSTIVSDKLLNKVKHKGVRKNVTAKTIEINSSKKHTTKVEELKSILGQQSVKLSQW